jgi:hypothetical protein
MSTFGQWLDNAGAKASQKSVFSLLHIAEKRRKMDDPRSIRLAELDAPIRDEAVCHDRSSHMCADLTGGSGPPVL